ncbi:hypothetical protein [Pseudomonas bohemica]|uniref:hypothetical protein n=1 Tax=Pseudomonas bohemica TaxID=2044872 RepID=UPI000DA6392C|nr:hypothetical protein [Pseudomonas bohemica]
MTIDYDAENWPGNPTPEEIMRRYVHLLEEECHDLQTELVRHRKNQDKLIDMHNELAIERNSLRAKLKETEARLSDCLCENALMGNRIRGLESCRDQLEQIHKVQREEAHKRIEANSQVMELGSHP